ncbi:MAG TPA: hypothetical protein VKG79_10585 [Bryobacteraceae bacterium]|nr:hypothetical protein [Bryobacteraceae bacterium]
MCDYSLHLFPNRLGTEGEELVVHRFGGASLGLASPSDLPAPKPTCGQSHWKKFVNWFQRPLFEVDKAIPAVCVPPGAMLILRDIPKPLQRELRVSEIEPVVFTQVSAEVNTYRDAIRFANDRQILLQRLREGQRVTIVCLAGAADEEKTVEQTPVRLRAV